MQINFNHSSIPIFELTDLNFETTDNEFNLSQAIVDLQSLDLVTPESNGITSFSSESVAEKRRILQRSLNLQDAAGALISHLKTNGSTLSGSLASDTSSESLVLTFGDEQSSIDSISNLSELRSGSFKINGVVIEIDTSSDSLEDIIDRINNSSAGVSASYDYSDQTVTISSLERNQILLENGSSNLFTGLNLHEGYISGNVSNDEESISVDSQTQLYFKRFAGRFNSLMNSDFNLAEKQTLRDSILDYVKDSIIKHIDNSFSSGKVRLESNIELNINYQKASFGTSTISFEDNDSPLKFTQLLTSEDGILSPFISLIDNDQKLQNSLNIGSNTSVIISTRI